MHTTVQMHHTVLPTCICFNVVCRGILWQEQANHYTAGTIQLGIQVEMEKACIL